jgi:FkbM family methyltransferase
MSLQSNSFAQNTFFKLVKMKLVPKRWRIFEKIQGKLSLSDALLKYSIDCVIDVGANVGTFGKHLRKMGYSGLIVSFEPAPGPFAELKQYTSSDPKWNVYQLALGSEKAELDFNLSDISELNSFRKLNERSNQKVEEVIKVKVETLDALYDDITKGLKNPQVFLKADTQGFDMEVIKGAAASIDKVKLLQSEVSVTPIYDSCPHYLESLAYYESLGFSLLNLGIVNRTFDSDETVLEYDCLMVRTS